MRLLRWGGEAYSTPYNVRIPQYWCRPPEPWSAQVAKGLKQVLPLLRLIMWDSGTRWYLGVGTEVGRRMGRAQGFLHIGHILTINVTYSGSYMICDDMLRGRRVMQVHPTLQTCHLYTDATQRT